MFSCSYVTFLTSSAGDRPLVAQFAANNARDFADAAEIISPFVDAVDLNCGCPQRCGHFFSFFVPLTTSISILYPQYHTEKSCLCMLYQAVIHCVQVHGLAERKFKYL